MATYRKIATNIWQSPTFRALGVEEKLAVIENIVLNKPAPVFERMLALRIGGPRSRNGVREDLYSAAWCNTQAGHARLAGIDVPVLPHGL